MDKHPKQGLLLKVSLFQDALLVAWTQYQQSGRLYPLSPISSPLYQVCIRRQLGGIEFNAANKGVIGCTFAKSDDYLTTAVGCDRKLLLHCRFVPSRGIDIEVTQYLVAINSHVELALTCSLESQFRPIEKKSLGRTRLQTREGIGKCTVPAAALVDRLRSRIAYSARIDCGRGIRSCIALVIVHVRYKSTRRSAACVHSRYLCSCKCPCPDFNAVDERIIHGTLRESDDYLTTAIGCRSELLRQSPFVACGSRHIKIA